MSRTSRWSPPGTRGLTSWSTARVGFEIQRSALTKSAAVDRTARSVRAGLGTVAWFTDKDTSPTWVGHVPGYRTLVPVSAWQVLPLPGSVGAAGLQVIEAVRCGTRGPCLHHTRNCSRFVPAIGAWSGLHVDDVVTGLAEDAIKPVRLGKFVRMLSADSIALYEELTGRRLEYDAGQPKGRPLTPSVRLDCGRPQSLPEMAAPAEQEALPLRKMCVRCGRSPHLPSGALCAWCDEHVDGLVVTLRAKRGGI